ncbi:MAG TPA: DNA methyltransferase, partial [bacterium]|nr:DNA methyltransferase [bacterium]
MILTEEQRRLLAKITEEARQLAEQAAHKALQLLGVQTDRLPFHLSSEQRVLRLQLRALGRRLPNYETLTHALAYEQWHRMLFTRFLAENELLLHPNYGVPITLNDCEQLARQQGEPSLWTLAARYAAQMLPGIFPQDDPLLQVTLATEDRIGLEQLLTQIPPPVFSSDDGLGWTYQFWQAERKDQVTASGLAVAGPDIPAVTQLFTEPYMVQYLLQNTLGAWWVHLYPASPLKEQWKYLRSEIEHDFSAWPRDIADLRLIDPCCGSGHFLVEAFKMLFQMRQQLGESATAAAVGVLEDNIYGLELDSRCVQIAAFALALTAWKSGYPPEKPLPIPHIACSGLPLGADAQQWQQLANGDSYLAEALLNLHSVFQQAPELGSLIDPHRNGFENLPLLGDKQAQLLSHLETALAKEKHLADPVAQVFGSFAKGTLRLLNILKEKYQLVVTNPPYLGRADQSETLRFFCDNNFSDSKKNLATCFVQRCRHMTASGGYYALVNPQNWTFLITDESLRKTLLEEQRWIALALLGPKAFITPLYENNIALFIFANSAPDKESFFLATNIMEPPSPAEKAALLREAEGLLLEQKAQLNNPDSRIVLGIAGTRNLLSNLCDSYQGLITADYPRFGRCFWEMPYLSPGWEFQQSTVKSTVPYGGREHIVFWEKGEGILSSSPSARIQGLSALGNMGVAISQMRQLPATLYTGELFDNNTAVIIPNDPAHLPALWAFCRSPQFNQAVRMIDQSLKVTNATLVQVPFDLDYWQAEADKAGPLPEPHSEDPTQWLFQGNVGGSDHPLQVAVARLVGYRWPQQPEEDKLQPLADADGIVTLPSVLGKPPAISRLRQMLAVAYGKRWGQSLEQSLLEQVGYRRKDLKQWLGDGFFRQHARLFHNRPFIWHIWDGRRDGFAALVNYHGLDRAKLEKLIYTYLGDWIVRQEDEIEREVPGAEARLAAAQALKLKLEQILIGDKPYDIYVRWKPISQQPLGWNPDLNDGVR